MEASSCCDPMLTYANPILPGFYPDPSVCRVGADFYMVTSSFEWFPAVPIFHSRDLVNWQQIGHCLNRQSQLSLDSVRSSGGIFAPTIRHHNGRFYMVTTDTTGILNFIVHTDDPYGEWSEPVAVNAGGIDPSLYFDEDGKVYFTANALVSEAMPRGLYLWEIDLETGEVLDKVNTMLWAGTGGKHPEASHLYKRDGWYYLLIAEGGTELGHMISVARSRSVRGPYESCPQNPILSHRSSSNPIQSTGHGDFFEDAQGEWWMCFLGVRHVGYPLAHHLGRETYLTPIDWSDDGWPLVNGGEQVDLQMEVHRDRQLGLKVTQPIRDDFDQCALAFCWNFRRNLSAASWSLRARPGHLRLQCLPASIDDVGETAFVGRRLQHFNGRVETKLDFNLSSECEEAGLAFVMNERFHCEAVLTLREGRRVIVLRKRCGSLVVETVTEWSHHGSVYLRCQFEAAELHFYAGCDAEGSIFLGAMETRLLSTEIAGGFTGLYFGMYASARGSVSQNYADFDWIDYAPASSD